MAWTTPRTWVAGETVTASLLNTHLRDNLTYAKGTPTAWSPVLQFGGSNTGITYSLQNANYIKIGDLVHVFGRVTLTNKGAASGAATLAAFPFAEQTGVPVGGAVNYYLGFSAAVVSNPSLYLASTTATFTMAGVGGSAAMDNTHFTNASDFIFNFVYRWA